MALLNSGTLVASRPFDEDTEAKIEEVFGEQDDWFKIRDTTIDFESYPSGRLEDMVDDLVDLLAAQGIMLQGRVDFDGDCKGAYLWKNGEHHTELNQSEVEINDAGDQTLLDELKRRGYNVEGLQKPVRPSPCARLAPEEIDPQNMESVDELLRLPHTEAEGEWLKERFSTLSAKESLALAAAMIARKPETAGDAINLIASLHGYQVWFCKSGYEGLGGLYLADAKLELPEMVLAHTNMDALGAAFEDMHPGLFIGDCYVMYPNVPAHATYTGENLYALRDNDWSVKVKLSSPAKPDGVWLRLPDYAEDGAADETSVALHVLGVGKLEECTILDAQCIRSEAGYLMEQYSDPAELVYDGNNLGYILDERGQGMSDFEDKLYAVLDYENCRTLKGVIDCAERMGQYCFVMADKLEDYARTELEKAGAPEMLIDCGVFDLKGFAEESLDQNGYVPDFTGCVYIKPRQQEQAMTTGFQAENTITRHSDQIKIERHHGTWSVIAEAKCRPEADESQPLTPCFLLEHEEYSDEAAGDFPPFQIDKADRRCVCGVLIRIKLLNMTIKSLLRMIGAVQERYCCSKVLINRTNCDTIVKDMQTVHNDKSVIRKNK